MFFSFFSKICFGYNAHYSDEVQFLNSASDIPYFFTRDRSLVEIGFCRRHANPRTEKVATTLLQSCGCAQTIDLVKSSTNHHQRLQACLETPSCDRFTFAL